MFIGMVLPIADELGSVVGPTLDFIRASKFDNLHRIMQLVNHFNMASVDYCPGTALKCR